MAIKPDDCVIRIEDLVVGRKRISDWDGRPRDIPLYEKYWENFNNHVDTMSKGVKSPDWRINPRDIIFNEELAKFGAIFKETKKWSDRYIKFKSQKHLTLFIMRWS